MLYDIKSNSPKEIVSAIKNNSLLRINNHSINSADDLIEFGHCLGSLLKWDFGYVNELKSCSNANNYLYSHEKVPFHWDGAFHTSPYLLIFHCITAPSKSSGGETLFAHSQNILDELSDMEINMLERCKLIYRTKKEAHYGGEITITPLSYHPYTNNQILRFAESVKTILNPVTLTVTGISTKERDLLISKITDKLYDRQVCYQHQWHDNELLIADNHYLLHGRNAIKFQSERHIRRIQIMELH